VGSLELAQGRAVLVEHLKELRYREDTIRGKLTFLKHFESYLAEVGIQDLREVGQGEIERFVEWERQALSVRTGRAYSSAALLGAWSAVKALYRALVLAELVLSNPTREVKLRLKDKGRTRRTFTEEEIARFLDPIDIHRPLGLRDRAIFELLYATGLRGGEVGKLDRADIDLEGRVLIVREAKWSKDRVVPIGEVAHTFLTRYLAAAGQTPGPVFRGEKGRLGRSGILKRFRIHLKEAGLEGQGLTVHSIRHATATHLLAHGADLRYVQELLGHESIETTVVYTNEQVENLKRIYRRFHPRENGLYREVDEEYRGRLKRLLARLEDPRRLAVRAGHRRRARLKRGPGKE
jgi:integrase/recombinase XerD